ncbi:hypothetical protein E4U54_000610 [Claviceps lovelessii]|nr:hypothetical protein E4U54_000610 [Claviceps lovelessii]
MSTLVTAQESAPAACPITSGLGLVSRLTAGRQLGDVLPYALRPTQVIRSEPSFRAPAVLAGRSPFSLQQTGALASCSASAAGLALAASHCENRMPHVGAAFACISRPRVLRFIFELEPRLLVDHNLPWPMTAHCSAVSTRYPGQKDDQSRARLYLHLPNMTAQADKNQLPGTSISPRL